MGQLKFDNLRPMAPEFNGLDGLILAAIADGTVPGLVLGAERAGQAPLLRAHGQRQLDPEAAPATLDTVYDLASLTKALVTSLLVGKGDEMGRLRFDAPLGEHLPALADRPAITFRRVLAHAAGFPAHRKFYESFPGARAPGPAPAAAVIEMAAREPLVYEPGTRSLYSDLGFILLGAALERALGERLDGLAERWLWRPLGLRRLGFLPTGGGPSWLDVVGLPVAPTERCPVRGRVVRGEVHDLNAFAMGGVAGHAGLFGTLGDVLALARALVAAYHGRGAGGGPPLVASEVVRELWRPAGIPGSTWRLGWDGPAPVGSLAGALIARGAVGHLSFTGCSLWIDPERETSVVVMCNRVHPEVRDDPRFRALRPALHDAALQAIGYSRTGTS